MKITQRCAIFSCASLFVFTSLLHYFTQRPLWNDEWCLLVNLQAFDYLGLFFQQLQHDQAFPRVYLVIIRFIAVLTDHHVLGLRFLPLVAMFGAYALWTKIYFKVFKETRPAIIAVLTFSASYYMTYYAAEFKAYSLDLLLVGLLCWYAMEQRKFETQKPTPKDYVIYHFLPFTILLSYSTIFIIPIIALNFLLLILFHKKHKLWLMFLTYSFLAGVAVGTAYFIDIRFSGQTRGLYTYWQDMFLKTTSIGDFMDPFWEGIRDMATCWYGKGKFFIRAGSPLIGVFLYGLVRHGFMVLKKDKFKALTLGSIFAVVFLELVVLGVLKKFPFTGARITLFIAPMVFYLTAQVLEDMRRIKWLYVIVGGYYTVYLTMSVINTLMEYYKLYQV